MSEFNQAEQSQPGETQPEFVNPIPVEDPVTAHERAAFMRYVQDQGAENPS